MNTHTITINNQTYTYQQAGVGPKLLILHGFIIGSNIWQNVWARLQTDFTLILVDIPGYGLNRKVTIEPNIEVLSKFVYDVCDAIEAQYIIGYSLSGLIVQHYLQHPAASTRKACIIAAPLVHTTKVRAAQKIIALTGSHKVSTQLAKTIFSRPPFLELFLMSAGLTDYHDPQLKRECVRLFRQEPNDQQVFKMLANALKHNLILCAPKIPTTYLYGEHDGFATWTDAKRHISGQTVRIMPPIPKAFHVIPLEQPEALANMIKKVFND